MEKDKGASRWEIKAKALCKWSMGSATVWNATDLLKAYDSKKKRVWPPRGPLVSTLVFSFKEVEGWLEVGE